MGRGGRGEGRPERDGGAQEYIAKRKGGIG